MKQVRKIETSRFSYAYRGHATYYRTLKGVLLFRTFSSAVAKLLRQCVCATVGPIDAI